VSRFVRREFVRQCDQLQLIAPKTFASRAAIQVLGWIVVNSIVEGYPGHRYHAGAGNRDTI
jgi:glycine hydroxymethyltransferase